MSEIEPQRRHWSRRLALQALYQWQLANNSFDELLVQFTSDSNWNKVDEDYFIDLVQASIKNHDKIMTMIAKYTNAKADNIDPVEKAILLFSAYELLIKQSTPPKVIISEAIILCKKFGSIDGYKFINGVLDKLAKSEA